MQHEAHRVTISAPATSTAAAAAAAATGSWWRKLSPHRTTRCIVKHRGELKYFNNDVSESFLKRFSLFPWLRFSFRAFRIITDIVLLTNFCSGRAKQRFVKSWLKYGLKINIECLYWRWLNLDRNLNQRELCDFTSEICLHDCFHSIPCTGWAKLNGAIFHFFASNNWMHL